MWGSGQLILGVHTLHPDLISKLSALFAFTTIPKTLGGSPPPPTHCLQVLQTSPIAWQQPLQPPRDPGHTCCFRPRLVCCSIPRPLTRPTQSWLQTYLEWESLSASGEGGSLQLGFGLFTPPFLFTCNYVATSSQEQNSSFQAADRGGGGLDRGQSWEESCPPAAAVWPHPAAGPPRLRVLPLCFPPSDLRTATIPGLSPSPELPTLAAPSGSSAPWVPLPLQRQVMKNSGQGCVLFRVLLLYSTHEK